MNNLGKEIEKRRKSLSVSQASLAEMSGISLRTICAIENGRANPSVDVLSKIIEPIGLRLALVERITHE